MSDVWIVRGDETLSNELRPRLEDARARGTSTCERVELSGGPAYLKLSSLRGKARWRHGLRLRVGLSLPRLREYENLAWLRASGFGAPRPLAAGGVLRLGLPVFQFLATEEVQGARTLREVFEAERDPAPDRRALLEELGRDVGRLHARGFVHRDLYPRNVLVREAPGRPRFVYLDAWRGGPGPGLRGPAHDLACLMLFGPELFTAAEQAAFLDAWFAERARLGHPPDRATTLAAVVRRRRRLALDFARRRRPGARLAAPAPDWTPPPGM